MERAGGSDGPAVLDGAARTYPPEILSRVVALCEADPRREACGFVVARGAALEVIPIPNAADRYHAADPAAWPRTSRDGYVMDPRSQLRVERALDADGGSIVAVWHSHVESGAAFSDRDRADAVAGGRPVLPGVEYLVAGLHAGRVTELLRYRWDGTDFAPAPLP